MNYTKKYLLEKLKENRLPHSYPTLIKYENTGIIPKPKLNSNGDRIYTLKEINKIVKILSKDRS